MILSLQFSGRKEGSVAKTPENTALSGARPRGKACATPNIGYEQGGPAWLLADLPRCGSPPQISPPAAGPDRRTGLPGARGRGAAHHPLEQRGSGPSGCRRRHRPVPQPVDGPPHPERGGPATASHAVLAHGTTG